MPVIAGRTIGDDRFAEARLVRGQEAVVIIVVVAVEEGSSVSAEGLLEGDSVAVRHHVVQDGVDGAEETNSVNEITLFCLSDFCRRRRRRRRIIRSKRRPWPPPPDSEQTGNGCRTYIYKLIRDTSQCLAGDLISSNGGFAECVFLLLLLLLFRNELVRTAQGWRPGSARLDLASLSCRCWANKNSSNTFSASFCFHLVSRAGDAKNPHSDK